MPKKLHKDCKDCWTDCPIKKTMFCAVYPEYYHPILEKQKRDIKRKDLMIMMGRSNGI